ncbi:MAG TPA: DUF192 domain-containing protein [Vicinamibacterales bacterium]|nr:DUF192 domain-containing protein [Vicinamibacterales bacterium]HPW19173.1 DUF192 domain-containing protein [Vicinamibacterales bacterium]
MSKRTFLGPLIGRGPGQCELVNALSGSRLAARVEPAFDSASRRRGLLGRDALPPDAVLVLAPCSAIHTISMRFPIDVIFVARNGTVLKTRSNLPPWRIAWAWRAHAVIEAAAGFLERTEVVPGEVVAVREIGGARAPAAEQDALPASAARTTAGPVARAKTRTTGRPGRVTLADLIAHAVPRTWFESVAIVQELCAVVLARGPAHDLRVPELRHVAITPTGEVELLAEGPAGHSPVHRASLVLLALTPEAELPVQLKLLALEELSPRPKLGNLPDLHKELEFFERPDRRAIIQGVYERYRAQTAPSKGLAAVPTPLLEPSQPRWRWRWWRSRELWISVAVASLAIAVALAVRAAPRPDGQRMRLAVSDLSRAASNAGRFVAAKASEQVRVLKWRLGLNKRPPRRLPDIRASSPAPAPAEAAVATPPLGPAEADARLPAAVQAPGEPGVPEGAPAPVPVAPTAAAPPSASVPHRAAEAGAGDPSSGAALPASAVVYTASDPLVVPPVLVRPTLPAGPPPGMRTEELPEVEIVVSAAGDVSSVRLVSAGAGARQAMMLSAVKAWQFRPATRGGQPVPYRLRLRLPAN